MEQLLAAVLLFMIGISLLYLLIGFIILPVIKLIQQNARLK